MKNIKLFEEYNSDFSISNIKLKIFSFPDFYQLIYGNNGTPKYKKLEDKIRYFSYRDLQYTFDEESRNNREKGYYIVMFYKKEIIGIIKLGWNPYLRKVTNHYWISYFSIDKKFQGKGLSKLMMHKLFSFAKENNFILEGSSRTEMGKERLSNNIDKFSKEYDIEYIPSENN